MDLSFTEKKSIRKNFGKLKEILSIPNLIDVQKKSYAQFLSPTDTKEENEKVLQRGLDKVFKDIFPIEELSDKATLEYLSYRLEKPKFNVDECRQRDLTYASSLKPTLRLVIYDIDAENNTKQVLSAKEQEVYMGDIPLMTPSGTFVINGVERVVVNQMHRSPGVFFDHDKGKTHASGKFLFNCRIIPNRGSWLDFEYDPKDLLYFRIDRKRKLPITTLLYALGYKRSEILDTFYDFKVFTFVKGKDLWQAKFNPNEYQRPVKLRDDLINFDNGKKVLKKGSKINIIIAKKLLDEGLKNVSFTSDYFIGKYVKNNLLNPETNDIFLKSGSPIDQEALDNILKFKISKIEIAEIDPITKGPYLIDTLNIDKNDSKVEAINDIYKVLRPGEPPSFEVANEIFNKLFFTSDRYDLSEVGRVKLNFKLQLKCSNNITILRNEDIIAIIKHMLDLKDGKGEVDDIDHLGNRRVRSVGELVENQFRIGILRMERAIKEKMSILLEVESAMPQDLINPRPITSVLKDFFATSQLSQFMDQTNPLSEITHKRRVSALGPGGLTRERAGFEVRDVHPTHYGRICPIETPEGPNIGLINSLATFSQVNKYGFIESPYRKLVDGIVTDKIEYLSAIEEGNYTIAQANSKIDKDGHLTEELVSCRKALNYILSKPDSVDYVDVSPKQLVSVAASLIPFLENDDANRALMGSNMMRQAVPLLKPESPLVGTGIERDVALDSGVAIVAKKDGIVNKIDGKRIVVKAFEKDLSKSGVDIYNLFKFQKSNQNTTINQKPLVKVGDIIKKGDIIADGPSTKLGELALGKNVTVAFMPWLGYNFEDSILISERCVTDDVFTSIHIEEYELMTRDTKLGTEEITRDIPNISEESLRNLDESGIVYIGAEVKASDILVGKVTPKGDSISNPEEKLLRSIFGEKATDVRDSSLKMPPGSNGTVIDVRVFNRHGIERDERSTAIQRNEIEAVQEDMTVEEDILNKNIKIRAQEIIKNKKLSADYKKQKALSNLTPENLDEINLNDLWKLQFVDEKSNSDLKILKEQYNNVKQDIKDRFDDKVEKIQQGDDLLPNVLKMVKVFVAVKRSLRPGDKMAGRHGNKGVISKIVPIEDMPYMENGKPVDVVLNPLGVPSRMNVGQILETHLGWACSELGEKINQIIKQHNDIKKRDKLIHDILSKVYGKDVYEEKIKPLQDKEFEELAINLSSGVPISTPVFDGASVDDVTKLLELAELPSSGQTTLWDGRTGEQFDRKVTVGIIYILKLHHLVEDKIHARSTGPYSLVTQQPLGGKAQLGGQRFGEMEVWALEAYGAAYTLQEILTVKSDDVAGRTKVYETIVKGDDKFESGVPESFNVLIKEIKSLGLNIEPN
jgi:DNA-directed RNA polymerase subunit beta